jgi:hypothetical protein
MTESSYYRVGFEGKKIRQGTKSKLVYFARDK